MTIAKNLEERLKDAYAHLSELVDELPISKAKTEVKMKIAESWVFIKMILDDERKRA